MRSPMASETAPPATSAGFDSVPKNDIIPTINPSAPPTAKTRQIILVTSSIFIITRSLYFPLISRSNVPIFDTKKNVRYVL